MERNRDSYTSPLSTRYASREMQYLFSDNNKFRTWRKLWIALAKAEHKLGLNVTQEQIDQLEAHAWDINYDVAEAREKLVRHDVMSHVYAYGQQCPDAEAIIHLGATSCYVGDNTDILILRDACGLVLRKCAQVLRNLSAFAEQYKALPCLAYTHLQPAQLTTVGKRATLWMNELVMDVENLEFQVRQLRLRGAKGTTGTQASFMELFEGNEEKVKELEALVAEQMGFEKCVAVSGQTYSRKTDAYVLAALSGVAQSACKFANDLRILQSFEEMEEPFEKNQIGSSAMPYKRNPMRSERICALARYVIQDGVNPAMTAATQWFERTLDDSANKRIAVAEAFLAVDAILEIYINITAGLVVYDRVVRRRVMEKLPFMATENIMMAATLAKGTTIIENVAREPEIVDLANILNKMGAKVKGAGTETLKIAGVKNLHGTEHAIIQDRIEAGTFMVAAALTKGNVLIKDAVAEHNKPLISKLEEMGVQVLEEENGLRIIGPEQLKPTTVKTLPHPGFPTDMQPQFSVLQLVAKGTSILTETVFENRFMHLEEMRRMNADFKIEGNSVIIYGPTDFSGAEVAATDLRAAAALVLAGLLSRGITQVTHLQYLDRGYYHFHQKLAALGAEIKRIDDITNEEYVISKKKIK